MKLMAAVGAFLGPYSTAYALLYACLVGAVLSVAVIFWKEGIGGAILRFGRLFKQQPRAGRRHEPAPLPVRRRRVRRHRVGDHRADARAVGARPPRRSDVRVSSLPDRASGGASPASPVGGGLSLWIVVEARDGPAARSSRVRRVVVDDGASSIVEFPFALLTLVIIILLTCQLVLHGLRLPRRRLRRLRRGEGGDRRGSRGPLEGRRRRGRQQGQEARPDVGLEGQRRDGTPRSSSARRSRGRGSACSRARSPRSRSKFGVFEDAGRRDPRPRRPAGARRRHGGRRPLPLLVVEHDRAPRRGGGRPEGVRGGATC